MFDAKWFADLITVARSLLGATMIWLGLTRNADALPAVIPIMILCWTGDFVDGGLAHRSRHPRRTWIGDHDLHADLFVSICLGIYLVGAGFVDFTLGAVYLIGWVVVVLIFGLERNLLMLAQAPVYLTFILIGLRVAPEGGYLMVAWVLAATAFNWRRFTKDIVPKFIAGMKSLWDGHGRPRHS